jgi:Icc-related predicted phosphoesterase
MENDLRILFSSDLHGMDSAFERFAALLSDGGYDAGILGGDLLDEYLTDEAITRILGIDCGELLDELPGEVDDPVETWERSENRKLMYEALARRVGALEAILDSARVPILLVLGNHDKLSWPDTEFVRDIHMRRVELGGRAFVGYRWTAMDRKVEDAEADMAELSLLIDRDTVLVSHSPPYGILDGERRWGACYGLPALRALRPKPWLHLVGHVHSLAGRRGRYINGSWPRMRKFFEIEVERRRVRTVE